ncbi:MAG: ZIP family metal transporter [Candidatus Saccharimonas sp.]
MIELLFISFVILLGAVASLIVGALLLLPRFYKPGIVKGAMALGAGALLGAAFFDLLPEAFEGSDDVHGLFLWALLGFLLFFVLERSVHWFHHHHDHDRDKAASSSRAHRVLLVLGNVVHNAVDGIAIGAAFAASIPAGVLTTIAIAAHEVPREVGDFGMLLGKGMRRRNVLLVHVLSTLGTLIAALLVYLLGTGIEAMVPFALAAIAGTFLYIAAADIIPDIHEGSAREANRQSFWLLVGVAIMPAVLWVLELFHLHA